MEQANEQNIKSNKAPIKGIIPNIMNKKGGYTLILARHGNTALNEDGDKIRGWKDVPLSPKGEEEAVELGKRLKKEKFDAIITSDLQRAQQTAQAISKETGVPVIAASKALRPLNAGIFQGKESNKILSQLNHYIDNPSETIPDGESFNDFKKRYLDEIQHIKRIFPDKTILVVAHHRNNVMLDAWLAGGQKPDYSFSKSVLTSKGIPPAHFQVYHLS